MSVGSTAVTRTVPEALLRVTARPLDAAIFPDIGDLNTPVGVRRARVARTIGLLAAFRGLRRDQLDEMLLMDAPVAAASRRVALYRILSALRQRRTLEDLVTPVA